MKTINNSMIYKYFPTFRYKVGFTLSQEVLNKECKKLGIFNNLNLVSNGKAATANYIQDPDGSRFTIVGFGKDYLKKKNMAGIVNSCAHEAVHVINFMLEYIGETDCSEEMMAYHVGEVAGFLMEEIIKYWSNK